MKAVILAAGKNSRFWPLGQDQHKCMYEVGTGKPVLFYTLHEIKRAGIKEVVVIAREGDVSIENHFKAYPIPHLKIDFTYQPKPLGMGNALLSAQELLQTGDYFILLNPNHINSADIIKGLAQKLDQCGDAKAILVGQKTATPSQFGIMEIQNSRVMSVEEKPTSPKGNVRIVGIYCFHKNFLEYLSNFEGEYSLEIALNQSVAAGNNTYCLVMPDNRDLFSLKYPWDLLKINKFLLEKAAIETRHSVPRVPPNVFIDGPISLGRDVKFLGPTSIKGPCHIGDNVTIGDYVVIRDHSMIGDGCVIGCRTEIKNSILGHDVHTHDNFIGDSVVGNSCRLGAGTITANRRTDRKNVKSFPGKSNLKIDTGLKSFGAIMGPGSKTGINVSIMPGVKIGQRSMIGPHTLVSEDVEDDCLYYSAAPVTKKLIRQNG